MTSISKTGYKNRFLLKVSLSKLVTSTELIQVDTQIFICIKLIMLISSRWCQ